MTSLASCNHPYVKVIVRVHLLAELTLEPLVASLSLFRLFRGLAVKYATVDTKLGEPLGFALAFQHDPKTTVGDMLNALQPQLNPRP